jgi:glutamine amidotransferase
MFAMDGTGAEVQQIVPQLLEHVPDFLRRNIKGKTSAELVFHLFLSFLHDAGHLDDPNLSTTDSRRALRDSLAMVYTLLTKAGAASSGLGNMITSNGRSLLGVRLDAPLHLRRLKVTDLKQKPDTFKGVLVLSAADPGEGFEAIPPRSVVAVSRDIRVDIVALDG